MNTLNKLFIFAAGAAVGSVVTWKLVKTKYEQIANEEIESVKEVFGRGHNRAETNAVDEMADEEDDYEPTEEEKKDYEGMIDSTGYRNYSTKKEVKKEEKEEEEMDKPYVISPDEFDENDDYKTVSLTYYEDGVLADEHDNVITDVEDLIGINPAEHFGEYEQDSVFVRDDANKTDYEILADNRKFGDIYHY